MQTWILTGKGEANELYRSMWQRAMDEMLDRLYLKNNDTGLFYLAAISG